MKIQIEEKEMKEALRRTVKKFGGGGSHITLPKKHIGKEVIVFVLGDTDKKDKMKLCEQDKEWIKGKAFNNDYAEELIQFVEKKQWVLE